MYVSTRTSGAEHSSFLYFIFLDGLYTKITGGQRIDLFGAQKADLPSIWKELVDAGFESGHAYGTSLYMLCVCLTF